MDETTLSVKVITMDKMILNLEISGSFELVTEFFHSFLTFFSIQVFSLLDGFHLLVYLFS